MRKLIYGMNLTLDGYIAAAGDDIGWSGPPSDERFQGESRPYARRPASQQLSGSRRGLTLRLPQIPA